MRSKELWLVEETHATVKPYSSVAPRGMKTYSESRIELRNLQILKKMLEKSSQFLSSEQPCSGKAWTLPRKLQELKNILGKLVVAVNLEAFHASKFFVEIGPNLNIFLSFYASNLKFWQRQIHLWRKNVLCLSLHFLIFCRENDVTKIRWRF